MSDFKNKQIIFKKDINSTTNAVIRFSSDSNEHPARLNMIMSNILKY